MIFLLWYMRMARVWCPGSSSCLHHSLPALQSIHLCNGMLRPEGLPSPGFPEQPGLGAVGEGV